MEVNVLFSSMGYQVADISIYNRSIMHRVFIDTRLLMRIK